MPDEDSNLGGSLENDDITCKSRIIPLSIHGILQHGIDRLVRTLYATLTYNNSCRIPAISLLLTTKIYRPNRR